MLQEDRPVSLTIGETARNPYDEPPPGMKPQTTLAGSTFKIQRVGGIDLGAVAGWDQARTLEVEDAVKRLEDPVYTQVTGEDGYVRFTDLPMGVYYVTEIPPDFPLGTPPGTQPETPPGTPPDGGDGGHEGGQDGGGGDDTSRFTPPPEILKRLPVTGASVVGVLIVRSLMLHAGILLLRRRKRDESSTERTRCGKHHSEC